MKFGICEHADGVLVEAVPDHIGYDLSDLLRALEQHQPATFTAQAQALLQEILYTGEAA